MNEDFEQKLKNLSEGEPLKTPEEKTVDEAMKAATALMAKNETYNAVSKISNSTNDFDSMREYEKKITTPETANQLQEIKDYMTAPKKLILPLSFCIMFHDEHESQLPACLSSIPAGSEIILLRTIPRDIPLNESGKIENFETINFDNGTQLKSGHYIYKQGEDQKNFYRYFSFSDVRNSLKSFATREWIVSLDADERIVIDLNEIKAIVEMPKNIGGILVSHYNYAVKENGEAVSEQFWLMRIFRNNPNIRWEGRVHEQIAKSVERMNFTIVKYSIMIKHLGYNKLKTDPDFAKHKYLRNYYLLMQDIQNGNLYNGYMMERLFGTLYELKGLKMFDRATI